MTEFRCPTCNGRGWVIYDKKGGKILPPQAVPISLWWEYCPTCKGSCYFTLGSLARKLDEDPATLERLTDLRIRSRVKTCTRILDKVLKMMEGA